MRSFLLGFIPCLLYSCTGHFDAGRQPLRTLGPPELQVKFDSATAAAHLTWGRVWQKEFSRYELQNFKDGNWVGIETSTVVGDTTLVVPVLRAGVRHRFRVLSYFGPEDEPQALASAPVEGGIHLFMRSWQTGGEGEDFFPTRLAINERGVIFAAGVGAGRVERFDPSGSPLGSWKFATEPLACLQTSTLDGPDLALDRRGNLHVVYNLLPGDGAPARAFWTKFDPLGSELWRRPLPGLYARHIALDGERIFIEGIGQLRQFDAQGELVQQAMRPPQLVSSLRFWRGRFAALVEPLSLTKEGWRAPKLIVYEDEERKVISASMGRDPRSAEDRGRGLLRRPSDFAPDPAGCRVFVVNAGSDRIEVFQGGEFLTAWGEGGGGRGQFRFGGRTGVIEGLKTSRTTEAEVVAGGIGRDARGYIYVADTFNNRIQKFQP